MTLHDLSRNDIGTKWKGGTTSHHTSRKLVTSSDGSCFLPLPLPSPQLPFVASSISPVISSIVPSAISSAKISSLGISGSDDSLMTVFTSSLILSLMFIFSTSGEPLTTTLLARIVTTGGDDDDDDAESLMSTDISTSGATQTLKKWSFGNW
eukprot:CAMPEP_0198242490 /NCGR_PEP_ID=MMETSP1446-20131203/16952_1 /TAXON_ID=1461542 ORGANISM="Unidentified sp, Strain CCMP2111" /NCGR_SAMPLE_ID=MMETSP1446 /ASSEMBLY_ACC=CAM_ASM_001112 /LENGTH=151 /DNA_ID=CAMNT_0043925987 /DNA_START=242 /DNA_END=694 /DNA_ORIENTATION=+